VTSPSWLLKPAPSSRDPLRHLLFIKGSLKDISALVAKMGALCGRPDSSSCPEGFDYKLYLHQLDERARRMILAALEDISPAPRKSPRPSRADPDIPAGPGPRRFDSGQTFDAFCVGPSNRLAFAAAREAAASPGMLHNPLVIRGPSSSGKTHLLNAIMGEVERRWGPGSAMFVGALDLELGAAGALRAGKAEAFGAAFRSRRALLIDDAHLLGPGTGARLAAGIAADYCRRGLQVAVAADSDLMGRQANELTAPSGDLAREVAASPPSGKLLFAAADRFFSRNGLLVEPEALEAMLSELPDDGGFPVLYPWLRRIGALRRIGFSSAFDLSLEPLKAAGLLDAGAARDSGKPRRLAFFYPESLKAGAGASLDRFLAEGRRRPQLPRYEPVLARPYPEMNAPGKDGLLAATARARFSCDAAVVADGDADDWIAAARSPRARRLLSAIAGQGLACAALPANQESEPDAYLAAHADLLHAFFHHYDANP
jgi:hypothetical protein